MEVVRRYNGIKVVSSSSPGRGLCSSNRPSFNNRHKAYHPIYIHAQQIASTTSTHHAMPQLTFSHPISIAGSPCRSLRE